MESDDDPEARIRELERPLSERARYSELGVPSQSPYPPPVYGPAQTPGPSARKLLWPFAFLSATVIAAVAGLILYAAKPTLPHRVPTNSAPASTGPARTTVVKSPARTAVTPSSTAAPGPTYVPAGSTFSVSGTHKNVAVNCDGCSVNVSGVSNTVDIEGNCDSLTVSGVENAVSVETAAKIGVSGFNNKVSYHSGEPEVSQSGGNNTVEQG
ncbi:DUF3060 domain-containing protein [Mycobacteroides franklinii]|uniref:DUF3060 domain-containing protein n=1 Tax=Mycobacteroides franklinii TaxID=948102 RepID=UPI000D6A506C|nr:DUF3060 domain-containing protein [Mycobacteroides franklinii]